MNKRTRWSGYTSTIAQEILTQLLVLKGAYRCRVRLTTKRMAGRGAGLVNVRFGSTSAGRPCPGIVRTARAVIRGFGHAAILAWRLQPMSVVKIRRASRR